MMYRSQKGVVLLLCFLVVVFSFSSFGRLFLSPAWGRSGMRTPDYHVSRS